MISKEHKKHGELTKPMLGDFGKKEVAVLGTSCEEIAEFVATIRSNFSDFNIAFADADHSVDTHPKAFSNWQENGPVAHWSHLVNSNSYQRKFALAQADAVLVNGNHFRAQTQVVICNTAKANSLRKRAEELTNVRAIILAKGMSEVPDYIQELVPNYAKVRTFSMDDRDALAQFFRAEYLQPAGLKALIMAGGRSIRMGVEKSKIHYHEQAQFLHLKGILQRMGLPVFVSCRADQKDFFEDNGCNTVIDRISDMGPLGGIVSAFMTDPDSALLVLACDIPLLDAEVLSELISARTGAHVATSFQSPFDRFPEPLIAIWEPKSYPLCLQFLAHGHSCPRKVLINSNTKVVVATQPDKLENVNTPEEMSEFKLMH